MNNPNSIDSESRVLITGANGFLGRHVVRAFSRLKCTLMTPTRAELDLTISEQVNAYFLKNMPTHIVHLAAACGGIAANIKMPAHFLHANAMMGLNLLEAARLSACEKFVLISTTCAYPETALMPLDEDDIWNGLPTSATRAYGLSKRFLHEAIIQYRHQYGLKGIVLVPANLYGQGDHYDERSHVVAALIKRYINARESNASKVVNWGTGEATREFLHVEDAARGFVLATQYCEESEPINLGTGIETSIKELATLIAELVDYNGVTQWDPSKPNGQPRRYLKVERAKNFGFEAKISLADGLLHAIQDFGRKGQ